MRRTLVLVNGEWSMMNKTIVQFIDHSPLTIHDPNAQVSDTTGDTQRTKSLLHTKISFYNYDYAF
ncbi:hypothetical protein [Panacibacter ginsenosidivorans]|uniref:hypothetical protein n=1 Tax=Panacibacter ginsenosidivorans TaxID=1813871 RepID=UPI00131588AB|nr:hypothetical protein [Panacibacter ginsenosidivorans]